jgi:predicted DNA-binding transcriptional regulator YafY
MPFADFDIARYSRESFGVIREKPTDLTVPFTADQAPYVRERQWPPSQRISELSDGRIDLTFQPGEVFEVMRGVLGWGDAAEIIRPAAMRRAIERVLLSAAGLYRID